MSDVGRASDDHLDADDLEQIEHLLREMPLRRPSMELDRRVASARPRRARRWVLGMAALAASVAMVIGVTIEMLANRRATVDSPGESPNAPAAATDPGVSASVPTSSQPIVIEQVWSMESPKEVALLDDTASARQAKRWIVRHVRMIDDDRRMHIEWNIPSEEADLVPLDYLPVNYN